MGNRGGAATRGETGAFAAPTGATVLTEHLVDTLRLVRADALQLTTTAPGEKLIPLGSSRGRGFPSLKTEGTS